MPRCLLFVVAVIAVALASEQVRAALTADELLLVVNQNEPRGIELANHYAAVRGVPDNRIIELDLPTDDAISREQFQSVVRPALRKAIDERGLRNEVRCIVTFYGVPLKVGRYQPTFEEAAEREALQAKAGKVRVRLDPIIDRAVATAEAAGARVPPLPDLSPAFITRLQTLQVAEARIKQAATQLPASDRAVLQETVNTLASQLASPYGFDAPLVEAETAELNRLVRSAPTAADRARALELAGRSSLLTMARVVAEQLAFLEPDKSNASFDSELALLFRDATPAHLWLPNPLVNRDPSAPWPAEALMTARLDGPDADTVRRMIDDAVAVEERGLTGKIVIDSRGIRPPWKDGLGPFDEQLRQLAGFLQQNATLPVVHDDLPETFSRTADGTAAVTDVAVYVGWYRLRKYNAPFDLVPGAVAFHVASFEMVRLQGKNERGWVAGLLRDGSAASLGPTNEPYLSAFPLPRTFVPLLLTGRYTLAEVYWATVPHVSWQMGLVGDPLYRPFAKMPGIRMGAP
ncbi:MAG: TIGR03790 family protein [Planctomycetota bacterium]